MAAAQREARRTLALAGAFAVAAAASAIVPHDTGSWLPLHLLLAGAMTLAVSGVTPMLAVGWSAGPAAPAYLAFAQRWLLAGGVVGLALGREFGLAPAALGAAGACVLSSMVLLAAELAVIARGRVERRFDGALRSYAVALVAASMAMALVMASFAGAAPELWRDVHVALNLLGFLGLVIAGTLPFFVATQARTKRPLRATVAAQDATTFVLAAGVAIAAAGTLASNEAVAATGYAVYAAGVFLVVRQLPWLSWAKARWGGPRLLMTAAAIAWWLAASAAAAVNAAAGRPALSGEVLVALAVGGYAQLLAASLAYLGPVLRGGGHERLAAGFRITRSWPAVIVSNAGVLLWVVDLHGIAAVAIGIWVVDSVVRGARLVLA